MMIVLITGVSSSQDTKQPLVWLIGMRLSVLITSIPLTYLALPLLKLT
ncbi:hypothetical protein [Vulcanisaeta distributa]|nr:hypothetical protein [Vulcanisaeta distributa]